MNSWEQERSASRRRGRTAYRKYTGLLFVVSLKHLFLPATKKRIANVWKAAWDAWNNLEDFRDPLA